MPTRPIFPVRLLNPPSPKMKITLLSLAATLACLTSSFEATAQTSTSSGAPPRVEDLQSGDLIWPKKPGALVPYNSRPGEATSAEEQAWQAEKDAYVNELRAKPDLTPEEKLRYQELDKMTYKEFIAIYLEDRPAGQVSLFGGGGISVGHVGIIEVKNGKVNVIEAMVGKDHGVQRVPYDKWIQERPGEIFWLARLKEPSPAKRAAVAEAAAKYLGKPYKFFNFNLEDDSGFYCSKLAWLAIRIATAVPPDDDFNPKRVIWFSPKQLMRSPHITMLFNPGDYGSR